MEVSNDGQFEACSFTMAVKAVSANSVMVALPSGLRRMRFLSRFSISTQRTRRVALCNTFQWRVTKVNIHTPAGLDAFVDHLDGGTPIILADMGAGAGQVAADWFRVDVRRCLCNRCPLYGSWRGDAGPGQR